jgi:hypothetical protein
VRRDRRPRRGRFWIVVAVLLAMAGSYLFGLYSYRHDLWPVDLIRDGIARVKATR